MKTLEEALAALKAEQAAHNETKKALAQAQKDTEDANKAALEAVQLAEKAITTGKAPNPEVTVKGKKYEVLFGINGLSKSELAKDNKLCTKLIEVGSKALKAI